MVSQPAGVSLRIALVVVLLALAVSCAKVKEGGDLPDLAAPEGPAAVRSLACNLLMEVAIEGGEGSGVPGVAAAPRWGMPQAPPEALRVRRSWTALSDAEKQQVAEAFLKLKQTTAGSGAPGAERADYRSFCTTYPRNLYDFYVELHASAFASMQTTDMSHTQMAHMGPQFLPWHRYLLLRLEADLAEVSGDPDFTLPYWNWEDCQGDAEGGRASCSQVFEAAYLGSAGTCGRDDTVEGYLVDNGFQVNMWMESSPQTGFSERSINCTVKTFQRNVGCQRQINGGRPPGPDDVAAAFEREVYDAAPYDSCDTDEDVSFRQYLEGYTKTDVNPICVLAGCAMHGLGHLYVGGDMASSSAPNDPIFFLHHANVDRIWATWQERNMASSETAADHGNPGFPDDWRGPLFNFTDVRAEEMLDYRSLGYRYDTNQPL